MNLDERHPKCQSVSFARFSVGSCACISTTFENMIYPNCDTKCWSRPGPGLLRTQAQITAKASPSVNEGWSSSPDPDLQHVRSRPGEMPDPSLCFGTGTRYLKCHTWSTLGVRVSLFSLSGDRLGPGSKTALTSVPILKGLRQEGAGALGSG